MRIILKVDHRNLLLNEKCAQAELNVLVRLFDGTRTLRDTSYDGKYSYATAQSSIEIVVVSDNAIKPETNNEKEETK